MIRIAFPASAVLLLLLTACANPYSQFYNDQRGGRSLGEFPITDRYEEEPQIYSTSDQERDGQSLREKGYVLIGSSSFNSGAVDSQQAVRHAKKVGAALVLIQSRYTDTVTVTSYHLRSVHGSGGYGNYSGTSATTLPGEPVTHQIPHSVDLYDYDATFWAKSKPHSLGVHANDLTDDMRREIGSNRGVVVKVVVRDSPAFNADIMSGDIITKINDEVISDAQGFYAIIARYAGQEVVLHTYREGREREVPLRLNPAAE
jgi:hypothetical protein